MDSLDVALRQVAMVGVVIFVAYGLYLELRADLSEGLLWTLISVFVLADIVLSLVPGVDAADPLAAKDKLVHVLVNGVLVLLLLFALVWRPTRGRGRWPEGAAAILFGVLAFGVFLEFAQFLVGRDASMSDVVANAVGGICGIGLWRWIAFGPARLAFAPGIAMHGDAPPRSSNGAPTHSKSRSDTEHAARRAELDGIAFLLMPAERSLKSAVVEVDARWRSETWADDADHVVWGRSWLPNQSSLGRALRFALDRERALRMLRRQPPSRLQPIATHRLRPPVRRSSRSRGGVRQALLGGALVELSRVPQPHRVVDAAAFAAGGCERVAAIRRGSGAAAVAFIHRSDGRRGVLRAAREGSPGDPARAGAALRFAGVAGIPEIPALLASGRSAGASWTLESFIEGTRPRRVTTEMIADVGRLLARLPRMSSRPAAPADDLRTVGGFLPEHSDVLGAAATRLFEFLPPVSAMRHGDLWAGNVLVRGSRVVGILDWDSWHAFGAPGTDLLYLFVAERWRRSKRPLGDLWSARPWCAPQFLEAAAAYWDALDVAPDDSTLEAIGVAAWATQVASSFMRLPQLVHNRGWMANNAEKLVSYVARVA
jgi:VanZ family protein